MYILQESEHLQKGQVMDMTYLCWVCLETKRKNPHEAKRIATCGRRFGEYMDCHDVKGVEFPICFGCSIMRGDCNKLARKLKYGKHKGIKWMVA